MERYLNISGNSPITNYQIENDRITVWFKGAKRTYSYSYTGRAGITHVDNMKLLAKRGSGLSAYITKNVRNSYD
jgi:hypothetical protein